MDEARLLELLGQAGIGVGALLILSRVVFRIGERMIAAINRVGTKLDDHTKHDTEALTALRQDVAVLSGTVEAVLAERDRSDRIALEGSRSTRARTNPEGLPVSQYAIQKPRGGRDG